MAQPGPRSGLAVNVRLRALWHLSGQVCGRAARAPLPAEDVRHASQAAPRPPAPHPPPPPFFPGSPPAAAYAPVPGLSPPPAPPATDARALALATRRVRSALADVPALGGRGSGTLSAYDFVGLLDSWPKELAAVLPGAIEALLRSSARSGGGSGVSRGLWEGRVAHALLRTVLRFAQEGVKSRELLEATKRVGAAAAPAALGPRASAASSSSSSSLPFFASPEDEQAFLGRYLRVLAAYGRVNEALAAVIPAVISSGSSTSAGAWLSPHLATEAVKAAVAAGALRTAVSLYRGLAALDVAPTPAARDALRKAFEAAAVLEMNGGAASAALTPGQDPAPPTPDCVALLLAQFPRDSDHPASRARQLVDAAQLLIATAGRGAPSLEAEAELFEAVVAADLDLASVRAALSPPAVASLLRGSNAALQRVVDQLVEAAKARTTRYLLRLNQVVAALPGGGGGSATLAAPAPAAAAAASSGAGAGSGDHLPGLLSSFSHALSSTPPPPLPQPQQMQLLGEGSAAAAGVAAGPTAGLAAADAAAAAVNAAGATDSPLVEDVLAALVNGSRSAEVDARRRLAEVAAAAAPPSFPATSAASDPLGEGFLDDPDFALLHSDGMGGGVASAGNDSSSDGGGSSSSGATTRHSDGLDAGAAAHLTQAVESGRLDTVASQHVAELLAFAAAQARAVEEGSAALGAGGVPLATRREAIAQRGADLLTALLGRGVHPTPQVLAAYLALIIQTRSPARLRPALDFLRSAPPASTSPEAIALYKKALEENCSRRTALTVYQCVPDLVEFGVRPSPATLALLTQMATAGWAASVRAAAPPPPSPPSGAGSSAAGKRPQSAPGGSPSGGHARRPAAPTRPAPSSPRRGIATLTRGPYSLSATPLLHAALAAAVQQVPVRSSSSFASGAGGLYRGGYAPLGGRTALLDDEEGGRAGASSAAEADAAVSSQLTDLEEPVAAAASTVPPSPQPLWGPSRDVLSSLPFTGTSADPCPAGDADIALLLGGSGGSAAAAADGDAAPLLPPLPPTRRRRGREYTPGMESSSTSAAPGAAADAPPAPAGGATTPLLQARFWVAPPRRAHNAAAGTAPATAALSHPTTASQSFYFQTEPPRGAPDLRFPAYSGGPGALFSLGSPASRSATAAAAVAGLASGGLSPAQQLSFLDAVGLGHAVPPSALAFMIREACALPVPPVPDILFAWTRLTRHQPALGALPRPLLWSLLRAFVGASQHGAAWDVFMRLFPGHTGSLPRARRLRELVARHFAALKRAGAGGSSATSAGKHQHHSKSHGKGKTA